LKKKLGESYYAELDGRGSKEPASACRGGEATWKVAEVAEVVEGASLRMRRGVRRKFWVTGRRDLRKYEYKVWGRINFGGDDRRC